MIKAIKAIVIFICVMAIAGGIGAIYLVTSFPKVGPASDITIEATPERLARGEYLANNVLSCVVCHSGRDWKVFAAPIIAGTKGAGGERFGKEMGLPGTFYAKNITPVGLGEWSDGEIVRAITSGVDRDDKALFPLMPYLAYNKMAQEDVYSVVAYLRTLKPVGSSSYPESSFDMPMNLIIRTIPQPYTSAPAPDPTDELAYGEYLTTVAACFDCHTMQKQGNPVEGFEYAGGFEFILPGGQRVRSTNITPDAETGIGAWNKVRFIAQFKSYDTPEGKRMPLVEGRFNSLMPWTQYAGMDEKDLGAIYAYLQTLKPVQNKVEKYPDKL
jgi:hypothetical protein